MTTSKIIKPLGDGKRRILSLDEAMAQIDAHQPPKPQISQEDEKLAELPLDVQLRTYLGVEWEIHSPKIKSEKGKTTNQKDIFTFDGSLARLRAAGYDRHPTPSEYCSLIMDYLDGNLRYKPLLKEIAEDILKGVGEWLSMAMKMMCSRILVCYGDPENLVWDEKKKQYVVNGNDIIHSTYTNSPISIPSEKSINLAGVDNDELIRFLYGRSFEDFPERVRKGDLLGLLTLPPDMALAPVCCSDPWRLHIDGCYGNFRASRGVRELK